MIAPQDRPHPLALASDAETLDVVAAIAHWREHGWAHLGTVASEETLARLRARADDIMMGRVVYEGMFFQGDSATGRYEDLAFGRGWEGPSLRYRKIEKLELDPLFRAWLGNGAFERVARAVIGPEVALYRATLFTKSAEGGTELPWHQDGGDFWGLDRDPELQIWTAIDDVPRESGCVEVVDGSHRAGLATPLGGTIPVRVLLAARPEERTVAIPARAGEVLLIHNHLWHRSGRNTTGLPRRAFTVAYMDARTRCVRKKRAARSFMAVF
ncbi:MAG: phytanoyl-CoA dioxygenase family protein [Polyangiaceae bacterium]